MTEKALIAMSGGVDSSASALLMKNAGFDCVGAMMRLSGEASFDDARAVCEKLEMPFYAFDFSEDFKNKVIEPFVRSYEIGQTPNPCIECNRFMKFGKLYEKAAELGCSYIVTGHYARVEFNEQTGRYLLKKAVNAAKDQSYVLYFLTQEQLSHIKLPLGDFAEKTDVRKTAEENGLMNAHKSESQDICFISDGDYARFIREFTGKEYPRGDFLLHGEPIGLHNGVINYTIGQRKGLGIAYSEPLYVCKKSAADNTVTLGTAQELASGELTLRNFNLISLPEPPAEPLKVGVRTRYHSEEASALAYFNADGTVTVRFDIPRRAIAPGQAAVLYDGDIVVGGGTIADSC